MRALKTAAFLALVACSSHDIAGPNPSTEGSGSALAFGGSPASAQGGPWLFAYDGTEHISTTKSVRLGDVLGITAFPVVAPVGPSLDNYDPWSGGLHTSYVEIDLTNVVSSNLTITGIVAGNDGDELVLWNGGGSPGNYPDTITYTNNDSGSTALNRLWLGNGKSIRIPNNDGLRLHYIGAFGWVSSGNTGTIVRANQFSLDPACVPTALASGSTSTDYNPFTCASGFTSYVRQDVTGGGTATISGLQFAGPPNQEGRELLFQNISTTGSIKISNDVGTAGNHILTQTGADITLGPKTSMTLHYDRDAVAYRVDAYTGGINNGVSQTCGAGTFVNQINSTGTVTCGTGTPNSEIFGTGGDGAIVFDGSTTITVNGVAMAPSSSVYTLGTDIEATNLTINNGVTVKTAGYRIFGTGTCTNNGTASDNGANGANGTTTAAGAGGVARAAGYYTATAGGIAGGINSTTAADEGVFPRGIGVASFASNSTGGGAGGAAFGVHPGTAGSDGGTCIGGGAGGGGGASGAAAGGQDSTGGSLTYPLAAKGETTLKRIEDGWFAWPTNINNTLALTLGGSGGGGGAAGGAATATGGGGGGAPGGIVYFACRTMAGSGAYNAIGGNGGNGGGNNGAGQGGSAGGGGGAGGLVFNVYETSSGAWTQSAAGGTKGTGSSGGAGAGDGAAGGNGGACVTKRYNLSGDGT